MRLELRLQVVDAEFRVGGAAWDRDRYGVVGGGEVWDWPVVAVVADV